VDQAQQHCRRAIHLVRRQDVAVLRAQQAPGVIAQAAGIGVGLGMRQAVEYAQRNE
jgi:hypothetical protein